MFVDGVTREATSLAIAYEDAGEHTVKGKSEPLRLWRALRVVAGVGGAAARARAGAAAGRSRRPTCACSRTSSTAPSSAAPRAWWRSPARRAIGKSRLLWEFDKYVDGLAETVLWHRGRCLSYGEGIAYWALAEIVRQRLGIAQDAPVETVAQRLHEGLERWVADPADREFLAPRLGVLLGLAERAMPRAELFAGWRMFLERLAAAGSRRAGVRGPAVGGRGSARVHRAPARLGAVEPIFILTLARHELGARHRMAGRRRAAARRSCSSSRSRPARWDSSWTRSSTACTRVCAAR